MLNNPFDYSSLDMEALIKATMRDRYQVGEIVKPPEPLITIDGYGIAFRGSIIEFSGLSKSRKSTIMAMIVAACLNEDGVCGNVKVHKSLIGKKVVWFDTEMSKEEVAIFQNSIMNMLDIKLQRGNHPPRYFCFRLREYDELSRYAIIDHYLTQNEDFAHKGDIGIFVVDGIADLLLNANDQDTSKSLVTRLTQWADHHECVGMTAIHTNKDGKDSTGAVGHFLNKKCSYHIRTEKPFGASSTTVLCHLARNGQIFPSYQIEHDGNGIPRVVDSDGIIGVDDTKKTRKKDKPIRKVVEPDFKKIEF